MLTSDVSQLYAERLKLAKPDEHIILPDIISKEPLGPVVRQGDDQWFNIVKWVHFAMINAEELGVSSKTIDEAMKSEKPDVKRLVGTDGDFGEQIGLTKDWAVRVVRAGRQLRRGVRAQRRHRIQARHSARHQSTCGPTAAFSTRRRSADRRGHQRQIMMRLRLFLQPAFDLSGISLGIGRSA